MAPSKTLYNQDVSNPQTKRFLEAIKNNNEAEALDALHKGANRHLISDEFDGGVFNTLGMAAMMGWPKVTQELISGDEKAHTKPGERLIDFKSGLTIYGHPKDDRSSNVLHDSVEPYTSLLFDGLVQIGSKGVAANPDAKHHTEQHREVWQILLKAKPELLTERNERGETPLDNAVANYDTRFVNFMTEPAQASAMQKALTVDNHTATQGLKELVEEAKSARQDYLERDIRMSKEEHFKISSDDILHQFAQKESAIIHKLEAYHMPDGAAPHEVPAQKPGAKPVSKQPATPNKP